MPWNSGLTSRSPGYLVPSSEWNKFVDNFNFIREVNYTAFTADVSVTATTVGTANQIVSSGAITYEAVPHMIEFYCPAFAFAANGCNVIVRDGTTVLGTMARTGVSGVTFPMYATYRVTPTAASHTYNVAGWLSGAGTAVFNAGTGGAAGDSTTDAAGFIRIFRVPT